MISCRLKFSEQQSCIKDKNDSLYNNSQQSIDYDTLLIDDYYWTFYISNPDELFFLMNYGKLAKFIGGNIIVVDTIDSDKIYRKFMIYKNYFIGEYGDAMEGYIDIFDINYKKLKYNIPNNINLGVFEHFYTTSLDEYGKNILIERNIDDNTILDSIAFNQGSRFIFEHDKIFAYIPSLNIDSLNNNINYKILNLNNENCETKSITVNDNDEVLCIFQSHYLALSEDKMYIAENATGKKIADWKIAVDRFFKGIIYQNRLFLYDWLNEVDVEENDSKKFVFIRQVIELPDLIKDEIVDMAILIEDPR